MSNTKLFEKVSCYGLKNKKYPKKNSHILTVVGSAECVLDDIDRFGVKGDLMVINHTGHYFPPDEPYQHLVSLHPEHMRINRIVRKHLRPQDKFNNYLTHTKYSELQRVTGEKDYIDYLWDFKPSPRSSGIFGCFIGIALGYRKIILLGIPLDKSRRFFDLGVEKVRERSYYNDMYNNLVHDKSFNIMKGLVRSASGNTRKILGEPTDEWINRN